MIKSIAVIIPTYNRSKLLTKALDSVKAQTRLPDQVIVVDDGSTDNTETACKQWMKQNSFHMEYIKSSNRGVSHARNIGIMHTQCELIATLDSDDLFEPDHIRLLELAFLAKPDLPLAFGLTNQSKPELLRIIEELPKIKIQSEIFILDKAREVVSSLNYITPSQIVFSKYHAKKIGYFNENYSTLECGEDWEFFYRILTKQKSGFINQSITQRIIGNDNLTSNALEMEKSYIRVSINLLADKDKLCISSDEINKFQMLIDQSLYEYRYIISEKGMLAYLKAVPNLIRYLSFSTKYSSPSFYLDPRTLMRALSATLRNFKLFPQAKNN